MSGKTTCVSKTFIEVDLKLAGNQGVFAACALVHNQLFLESTFREPSSVGQLDPLISPKWPSAEHRRFPTEANMDRPAKKEWQSPVKHPRRKCWSAHIANGGMP